MPYPWSAGNVLTATDLNSALAAKTDTAMTQNAQTGTSYSYVLLDAAKLLTMNNASANTVTVTKQATVTWVTGTQLRVMNLGAGTTTLVADTGVTINGNVALKQYQGGTLIRTASDVWLFVPTASSSGMDLITPTSVAGSGVTLSGGQVTFTAATSVSINGCFSSAYDNYEIVMSITNGDTNYPLVRMRTASDDAGANYNSQLVSGDGASVTGFRATSGTSWSVIRSAASGVTYGKINLFSPNLAVATQITEKMGSNYLGASTWDYVGQLATTTQYTGFSVLAVAAAISGTFRIYGRRNS